MTLLRVSVLTLFLALAASAPSASAAVFSGSATDPAGDGPAPGQDIAAAEAAYDDAGSVTASMTLAGEPTADHPMFAFFQIGTKSGTSCVAPFVAMGGTTDSAIGVWGLSGDAASAYEQATVTRSGAKLTITASSPRMAGGKLNCLYASLAPKTTPANPSPSNVDQLDAIATLAAPPVAPPPPPPPPPTPTTPTAPPPAPPAPTAKQVTQAAAKPAPKAAQLAVTVSGVPATIRRARWMTLKVRVANTGTAAATGVKLRVGAARGLSARPRTIAIKTLKAGKSTTRRVKLALTKKARTTTNVTFTASGAKKLVARGRLALRIGKAKAIKKPAPGAGTPSKPKGPLAGTYWWYNINHVDWAWDNHGVYFLDDRWAYRGIPKGGLPTSCTAVTAGIDDKGNQTDGCITYTYDAATGAVTLGAAAGTFKNGELRIFDEGDERYYERLVIPEAGARFDVDLLHRSFSGMCGMFLGCTTSLDTLRLLPNGEFIKNGSTTTTMGDPGIGPFTYAGSYPPDEHGLYEVQAGGRIHLAFADGTAKGFTFAIQTKDGGSPGAGEPDPVNEGVILDEDNFYRESD